MTAYCRFLAIVLLACGLMISSGSVASAIGQPSWRVAVADNDQQKSASQAPPKSAPPASHAGAKAQAKPAAAQGTDESEEEPAAEPESDDPVAEPAPTRAPKPQQPRTAAASRTNKTPVKSQGVANGASTGVKSPRKSRPTAASVHNAVGQVQAEAPIQTDAPIQTEELADPFTDSNSVTESMQPPPEQTSPADVLPRQSFGASAFGRGPAPQGFGGNDPGHFDGGNPFDDSCCEPMCDDGPCRGPIYVRADYLMWWLKGDRLPPLVTTSPSSTSQTNAGVLGLSTTSILFGNQAVNNTGRSGARLVAGWWLSPNTRIEGEGFVLGGQSTRYNQSSTGSTILARPFFNLSSGAAASNVLAYPGVSSGSVSIRESSNFVGGGVNFVRSLAYDVSPLGFRRRFDVSYGFRYLGLYENLTEFGTATLGTTGASLTTNDRFKTSNSFFGGNIGASVEHIRGPWSLLSVGRLGIGGTSERVAISGNSVAKASSGSITNSNGGFLAMPTNIGSYTHGGFTLVPQLEFKLAYFFNPNIVAHVGYDVMYWSRVARPGGQIDTSINPTQASGATLRGTPGPTFQFHESDLWIQGVNTGVEFRF